MYLLYSATAADCVCGCTCVIDELVRLAMRLKGPFNIENVIVPIDVKISDAIMIFQENAEAITDKVSSHDVLARTLAWFLCLIYDQL